MENWASDFFEEGVEARVSGICGVMSWGTLKEAKIVRLSRRPKRPRDVLGIFSACVAALVAAAAFAAAAEDDLDGCEELAWLWPWAPNSFANRVSL